MLNEKIKLRSCCFVEVCVGARDTRKENQSSYRLLLLLQHFLRATQLRGASFPLQDGGDGGAGGNNVLDGGRKRLLVSENHPLSHFSANKVRVTGITLPAISCWWQWRDAFVVLCFSVVVVVVAARMAAVLM